MRIPDLKLDGWRLEDGETRHLESPRTFELPPLEVRLGLDPGDFAKLIFSINVDDQEEPITVERMWVIVSEKTSIGYLGILDNDPNSIAKNGEFWSGVEIPFEAKHIIDASRGDEETREIAKRTPIKRWRPSS